MKTATKNTLKALAVILLPLPVLLVVFLYLKKKKEAEEEETPNDDKSKSTPSSTTKTTTTKTTTTSTTSNVNKNFPLSKNTSVKTDLVKEVQEVINYNIAGLLGPNAPYYNGKYFNHITADGYYGNQTAAAIAFLTGTKGDTLTKEQFQKMEAKISPWLNYI